MFFTLDGRSLWWSYLYKMYLPWYWIDDDRWWYEHLEVMPSWMVSKAKINQ